MKFWRLKWMVKEISTLKNYRTHKKVLHDSWRYWLALFVKFLPGISKKPLLMRLKGGGAFYIREFMSLYIYKEVFVDKCYDLPQITEPNPVIIDVGGNTGMFSIRMKQLYPSATIYCFEPFPPNFQQLSTNMQLSQLKDVTIFQMGVGSASRKEKLYIHKTNLGGHSILQEEAHSDHFTEIELTSLRDFFKTKNLTRCHLLKMDCEGAEGEIIRSLDKDFARLIDRIVFEPTPSAYDLEEIKHYLISLGYSVAIHQGLYIAIRNGDNTGGTKYGANAATVISR